MKLKKYIIIAIMLFFFLPVQGQYLSNRQKRSMNEKLVSLLNLYSNYMTFGEQYMADSFVDLFENGESSVYCDFSAHEKFSGQITARQYSEYSSSLSLIQAEITDVERGAYVFDGKNWRTTLTFSKELSYIDELGVYFSGVNKLKLDCVFEDKWENFRIDSISGEDMSETSLPGHFVVVGKSSPYDEKLYTEKGSLIFNEFGQTVSTSSTFNVLDDDVFFKKKLVGSTARYDLLKFDYSIKCLRVKPRLAYSPFAYRVSSSQVLSSKSSSFEGGLDFGYIFPSNNRFRFGLNIGVGISISSLDLNFGAAEYKVPYYERNKADGVYEKAERYYSISSASEGFSFTDITVPLYASFEYRLKGWSLILDLGPKINLNVSVKPKSFELAAKACSSTSGFPTTYETVSFPDGFLFPGNYSRNRYDVSVFGDLGADINITRSSSFMIRVGYEVGVTPCYESSEKSWFDSKTNIFPIIYRNGQDIRVRSFVDCISFSRNALYISVGWKWKL